MLERLARALTRRVLAAPGRVTLIFVAVLALGALGASKLEMRLNYLELLPEGAEEVLDLHFVSKKAGSEGYLVVSVTGGDRPGRLRFTAELAARMQKLPALRYAEYRYDNRFFRENGAWLLPIGELGEVRKELEQRITKGVETKLDLGLDDDAKNKPTEVEEAELDKAIARYESALPKELIENDAQTELFILGKPVASFLGGSQAMIEQVSQAAEALRREPGNQSFLFELGGPPVFQRAFDSGMRGDLGQISIVALLLASFLLLLATRRPLAALLILVPIAIAISVSLAVAALTIGHLTIISGILVAVLLGLGVEFGIHLILRTAEARTHRPLEESLLEAVPDTMAGAFTGAVTNAAAFAVLLFCDFKAFREFGMIAALGILLSWLFSYALLPVLVLLVERRLPGWVIRQPRHSDAGLWYPRWVALLVLFAFPVFCLYGAFVAPKLEVERNFRALHGTKHPDPVGYRAVDAMHSTLTPVVAWVKSLEDAKKLEEIFAELIAADKDPEGPIVSGTTSLARLVHADTPERRQEIARLLVLLRRVPAEVREKYREKLAELEAMLAREPPTLGEMPEAFTRKLTPLDGAGTFVLIFHTRSLEDAKNLDDFVGKVDEGLKRTRAAGVEVRAMSENRIAVRIFRQVFSDAPFISWAATLVVLLTLFALLRNVRDTVVVFVPIALGMLAMAAGMYLFKVKLNFINMAVIPSIFTIAIDNTVHLYHRYAAEGRDALGRILRHTGAAVVVASCVNASGYGPTLLADFYGLRSLGYLAMLGMGGMVLATVVWFPAFLKVLPERRS